MTEPASNKRAVNTALAELLEITDAGEPIAFFCECDDPDCYRPVWLSRTEYERRRVDAPALAPSHARVAAALRSAA